MAAIEGNAVRPAPARGWRARAAALGKALLFPPLAAVGLIALTVALTLALRLRPQDMVQAMRTGEPQLLLVSEAAMAGGAVMATAVLAAVFREPLARFGLGEGHGWGRRLGDLGVGLVCGFGLLTALLVGIAALGGLSFGGVAEPPGRALAMGGLSAALFALVALAEEASFRGYVLTQLGRAFGFWPAAATLAVLFGLAHAGNPAETPAGLVSAGAIGLVLAYSFRRSGSLMWALGFHAAWDYAQSFVWGVPDSGVVTPGALFHAAMHGPAWLTGGSAGPEASGLAILAIAGAAALVVASFPAARRA